MSSSSNDKEVGGSDRGSIVSWALSNLGSIVISSSSIERELAVSDGSGNVALLSREVKFSKVDGFWVETELGALNEAPNENSSSSLEKELACEESAAVSSRKDRVLKVAVLKFIFGSGSHLGAASELRNDNTYSSSVKEQVSKVWKSFTFWAASNDDLLLDAELEPELYSVSSRKDRVLKVSFLKFIFGSGSHLGAASELLNDNKYSFSVKEQVTKDWFGVWKSFTSWDDL